VLAAPVAERFEIFGNPADGPCDRTGDAARSADWHVAALRDAGFDEARAVWRSFSDAMVLALK
jgi:hypothetical protein